MRSELQGRSRSHAPMEISTSVERGSFKARRLNWQSSLPSTASQVISRVSHCLEGMQCTVPVCSVS